MDYSTVVQPLTQTQKAAEINPHSLYSQLQAVTDPRKKRGVRYSVVRLTRFWGRLKHGS